MFILLGRIVYLCIWSFLLLNLFKPYPAPANFICYVALASYALLHGIQALLLSFTLTEEEEKKQKKRLLFRFFIFGFIEAVSWKNKSKNKKT